MKIALQPREGDRFEVEVADDKIGEVSFIEHRKRFYRFVSIGGRFFSLPLFEECEPPLKVD